jgi:hypothetical protein
LKPGYWYAPSLQLFLEIRDSATCILSKTMFPKSPEFQSLKIA